MQIGNETFDAVREEWDALADHLEVPPFLRAGWFAVWWDAFGNGQLRVVTVRRHNRLVGVLPVIQRGSVITSPTNSHTPLFGPIVEDQEVVKALAGALFASGMRRIDLSFLEGPEGIESCLRNDIVEPTFRLYSRTIMSSPYLPIEGDWDSYWKSRSRNLRSTVRRCRNRLADLGEVTVQIANDAEGIDALLAEGFEIEESGWKEERGTAIASRPETHRFYREVAHWATQMGILKLAFLRIDGRAVAFNFSLESAGNHYLLKLGHDAGLNRAGPGTVLTAEMLKRAFSINLRSYEFLGADDRYKLRWTGLVHDRLRVQAFAPSIAGRADAMIQVHARAAARRMLRR